MQTRTLGKTNSLNVSAVGMGCMGFSHGHVEKFSEYDIIKMAETALGIFASRFAACRLRRAPFLLNH